MAGIKLQGTQLPNNLVGSADNDTIVAGGGADTVTGASGNDILWGGTGGDIFVYLSGQTGSDQLRDFSLAEDKLDVSDLGITTLAEATAGATVGPNGVILSLDGQTATLWGVTSIAQLTASNFIFTGTTTGQAIQGTQLANDLVGTPGNDTIVAGGGADTVTGASGNDILWGGAAGDVFVYLAGQTGNDQVRDFNLAEDAIDVSDLGITTLAEATAGATVGPNGVILNLDGQTATLWGVTSIAQLTADNFIFEDDNGGEVGQAIQGTQLANNLVGTDGNDTIVAGGGADTVTGASGNDILWGGAAGDVFVYLSGDTGNDQVRDFSVAEDKLDVSDLGITTLAEATAGATAGPNGVVLDFDTQTATLWGVTLAELTASNFIFA